MLWVIMPAYNEEASVGAVLDEWIPVLRALGTPFTLLAINDGSHDATLAILEQSAARNREVAVVNQSNRGHGQSCVAGYRLALEGGATWICQIDSDGQCDPRCFPPFWAARHSHPAIFGLRAERADGWARREISRVVSAVVRLATGTRVADANVPYRLMRREALEKVIGDIPSDFELANILLAVRLERAFRIHWMPIHFRKRSGGSSTVRWRGFVTQGVLLYRQLRRERQRTASR